LSDNFQQKINIFWSGVTVCINPTAPCFSTWVEKLNIFDQLWFSTKKNADPVSNNTSANNHLLTFYMQNILFQWPPYSPKLITQK